MPGWGEIGEEIAAEKAAHAGEPNFDVNGSVLQRYIDRLSSLTNRPVVVYAADWTGKGGQQASIDFGDTVGLMEVFRGQTSPNLDLILHSGGGTAEACDALVGYMRSKFNHVRVFVPQGAMSAATMWAMAADEIVMAGHSHLGPIDPQINLPSGLTMPAGALTAQFREASDQCLKEPGRLAGWLPTLQQFPPGVLEVCEKAAALSKTLVEEWLKSYMLRSKSRRTKIARDAAEWLADDQEHLTHGRAIRRERLREKKLNVTDLEDDQDLQDAVLSVFHVLLHTFSQNPGPVKIIWNQLGRKYIKHGGVQMLMPPGMLPQLPPGIIPQPPAPPPASPQP
jgi:hypothetical protein